MGRLIDKQRLLEDARKLKSAITGRDKPFPVAEAFMDVIEKQPEKRTQERTETHACDCISRQAAIDAINRAETKEAARWSVEELPSAQPTIEPRAKGHWVPQKGGGCYCSECEEYALDRTDGRYVSVSVMSNFCPNCGADMRGGQNETD